MLYTTTRTWYDRLALLSAQERQPMQRAPQHGRSCREARQRTVAVPQSSECWETPDRFFYHMNRTWQTNKFVNRKKRYSSQRLHSDQRPSDMLIFASPVSAKRRQRLTNIYLPLSKSQQWHNSYMDILYWTGACTHRTTCCPNATRADSKYWGEFEYWFCSYRDTRNNNSAHWPREHVGHVTREYGQISRFWPQVKNLHKTCGGKGTSGWLRLFLVHSGYPKSPAVNTEK